MERAQQVLSSKSKGTSSNSKFVIASLSNEVILDRAKALGVLLGENANEESTSVDLIKNLDLQRMLPLRKEKKNLAKMA
jgi:hypothetical protein